MRATAAAAYRLDAGDIDRDSGPSPHRLARRRAASVRRLQKTARVSVKAAHGRSGVMPAAGLPSTLSPHPEHDPVASENAAS